MPLTLLTPIPTPQGDLSAVRFMLWQSDGLQLALAIALVPALALARGSTSDALAGIAAMATAAGLGLSAAIILTARRLRDLREE